LKKPLVDISQFLDNLRNPVWVSEQISQKHLEDEFRTSLGVCPLQANQREREVFQRRREIYRGPDLMLALSSFLNLVNRLMGY